MQIYAVALLVLLSNGTPALASGTVYKGDRTMTKVVKMLQEMMKKSQEDGEKDRKLYADFKCYCDDNEAEKKASIEEYKKEIQMLENQIDKIQASSGELSSECAQLSADIAENEQARKDAEQIREKEAKDFTAEEEDMVTGLDAMDDAIKTLAAVGADQTASTGADHERFMGKKFLLKLHSSVKRALAAVSVLLSAKEKRTVDSFLQAPFTGTYTSQSGEIVGILKNMRDTFKENLASIRAAEKAAIEAHEKFMKIKKDEHATMSASYEEKQGKLGDNDSELAGEREKLKEAQESLANDEEFLAKLLKMCAEKAEQFSKRNLLRANEEAAISQAISILNSDAAFEAFGKVSATKSGATGLFLQIGKHNNQASLRNKVIDLLSNLAEKQRSLKIARILVLLQAENPFDTVLKEIKKMIAIIDEEQKADEEQKKWCETERDEYHTNKEKAESSILDLQDTIAELDDSINNEETGFKALIKADEESLKANHANQVDGTSQRAEENKAYQTNIKNIVAAEDLLKKAIDVLNKYYAQFNKEFLQDKEDPAPPDTWDDEEGGYDGQRDAGSDVIKTLEFIAEETQKEETEAHSDEEEAQHEFEDEMAKLKEEQTKLEENIAALKVDLAEAEKSLGENKVELVKTEEELKGIEKYLLKIKPGCDYIEENYDTRTDNRKAEKESLEKATGMLKDTPAYKAAVAAQEQEDLGECKDICNAEGKEHAKCKACLAGVSVPGYCAGHGDTEGC